MKILGVSGLAYVLLVFVHLSHPSWFWSLGLQVGLKRSCEAEVAIWVTLGGTHLRSSIFSGFVTTEWRVLFFMVLLISPHLWLVHWGIDSETALSSLLGVFSVHHFPGTEGSDVGQRVMLCYLLLNGWVNISRLDYVSFLIPNLALFTFCLNQSCQDLSILGPSPHKESFPLQFYLSFLLISFYFINYRVDL